MFSRVIHICLWCCMLSLNVFGQRNYEIKRIEADLKIDGELNESHWERANVMTDFITNYPKFGDTSNFKSEVRLYYDNDALYVGGILYDPEPDSVSYTLSQRDDFGNADWCGILLDPYATAISGFSFSVTSAGVEVDALELSEETDYSWNAVWKSATAQRKDGWSFEMRIPFSAVRFPNKNVQEWNINFARSIRRNRETSWWNPVDPNQFGEMTQAGKMVGMKDVKSPIRLSLVPYTTGYVENSYDDALGKQTWRSRMTYGLDLKYGLNDAFTLDMTLIPDFGQTVSDNQVLNLGPFEVRFNENRPFFLEGTDLFSIGGVFYSRRIGARPFNYGDAYDGLDSTETVINNPELASMLNGTKVSGRTQNGLGIGVFNAIEGPVKATIENQSGDQRFVETHPLTNYNVFVLSQNLKNNSSVSFVNTNVMRSGGARDANVTVGEATIFTADRHYAIDASLTVSSIFNENKPTFGHTVFTGVRKVYGKWRYQLGYGEESDTYDPNDLGFLFANNSRFYNAGLDWNDFSPRGRFLRRWASIGVYYEELYKPHLYANNTYSWSMAGTFRNFLTAGINGNFSPFGEVNHFESRTFGKEVKFNPSFRVGGFYSSDYSKPFALDLRFWYKQFTNTSQKGMSFTVSPRARLSDKLFLVWRTTTDFILHDYGYVSKLDDNYADDIILGYRDRQIVENSLQMEYIFTKRMGIDLRLRHYWQQVKYKYFVELLGEGRMVESAYHPLSDNGESAHNTSYNAFTVDINYRWVFIPGSELRLVYKNNIFNAQNQILPSYFSTFGTIFDQPQINSISMKLLVFVDAIYFRKKSKKRNMI